jgi:hypothetical protein
MDKRSCRRPCVSDHSEAMTTPTSVHPYVASSAALEVQMSLLFKIAALENRSQGLSGPDAQIEPFAEDFKANAMQAIRATKRSGALQM